MRLSDLFRRNWTAPGHWIAQAQTALVQELGSGCFSLWAERLEACGDADRAGGRKTDADLVKIGSGVRASLVSSKGGGVRFLRNNDVKQYSHFRDSRHEIDTQSISTTYSRNRKLELARAPSSDTPSKKITSPAS
jgi:hypothetical protein